MGQIYTYGVWKVKPGMEREFVAAWEELAAWSLATFPSASEVEFPGLLLRDRDDPTLFATFGPWESEEVVRRWRGHPGFHERVAGMRPLLETFEPHLMDEVARAGG